MNIQTKYHGEIEIQNEEILIFNKGIPGFPEEKEFVTIPFSDDGEFLALQSLTTSALAFIIANPFSFDPTYDVFLEDHVVDTLGITEEKDVVVYSILTVQDPFEDTTANFQAPLIINTKNRQAMQVILNQKDYTTKHPVFKNKPTISTKG